MIHAVLECCAGIDVGKSFVVVCLLSGPPQEEPRVEIRKFGVIVSELLALSEWLKAEGCSHVAMESTGSYWRPIFNVLEEAFEVILANALEVKNRKGHKTDWKDSRWLAHLLRHGMIRPSFIPTRGIRELRDLTRRRRQLMNDVVAEKNRLQRVLEDGNVKLSNVLTDIFGVSGMDMLSALIEGTLTPDEIAQLARRLARAKIPEITESLRGHRLTDNHRFLLKQGLAHIRFLRGAITDLEAQIAMKIQADSDLKMSSELLQTIPGIKAESAAIILAEAGPDMTQFPTPSQFSSWAGLCPGNNKSGGKDKIGHTTKGNRWLRGVIVECAWASSMKKETHFSARYRRLIPRTGKKRAIIAVAHSLLKTIHYMLLQREPYRKTEEELAYEQRRRALVRHHTRALMKLGVKFAHQTPE